MGSSHERPLPNYVEGRENKESFKWQGLDTSFHVFPHLNLDWRQIQQICTETKKPVGDLGSSFSTIPTEGELRGITVIPVDLMREYHKKSYSTNVFEKFNDWRLKLAYQKNAFSGFDLPPGLKERMGAEPIADYWGKVQEAIQKVEERYVLADLARIPLQDRALSISIVHDAVPKHSAHFEEFLRQQLPEILRVTNTVAYVYPLATYKIESSQGHVGGVALTEARPLYKDVEALEQIRRAAEASGFEFMLEQGSENEYKLKGKGEWEIGERYLDRRKEKEARLGVFRRLS